MDEQVVIRQEKSGEERIVETLVREAFWNVYRPGCMEHYLLHVMRQDEAFVPELNLVMEKDGEIIGHVAFAKGYIQADDGRRIPALTLGPICIAPAFARKGYGKKLLDESLTRAAQIGAGVVCLEGNIAFYGKSGFTCAAKKGIRYHGMPEGEDVPFFLCRELIDGYLNGITGEYEAPPVYFVSDEDAEAYDRAFPPKEKLKLPGQLF